METPYSPQNLAQQRPDSLSWEELVILVSDLVARGKYDEALERAIFSLEIAETFGVDDRRLGMTLELMAEIYYLTKQYTYGGVTLVRLVELYKRILGPTHLDTTTVMLNAAMLFHSCARYEPAEIYYLMALNANIARQDADQVRNIQIVYARLLRETGRGAEADAMQPQSDKQPSRDHKMRRSGQFEAYKPASENRLH